MQINPYWFQDHFTGEAKDAIDQFLRIIKTAPERQWYDRSDAMTDYFDTAFYIHLNIGEWSKPYVLVK